MSEALPSEIEIIELPGGAHYRLPSRNLGGLRYAGLFLVIFGLCFGGFAVVWMLFMAGTFWRGGNDAFDWFGVLIALFAIPFVLAGLTMLGIGLAIWTGRSEVVLEEGRVRGIERAGPFRLSYHRPVEQIRQFVVSSGNVRVNNRPVTSGPLADLAAIKVDCKEGRPVALALGYPRGWLLPLANDLARRCNLLEPTAGGEPNDPVMVVEERLIDEAGVVPEQLDQPAGSDVVKQPDPTGVTLTVPPAGLRKGSKGLFAFSVLWLGFMVVFTSILGGVFLLGNPQAQGNADMPWPFLLIVPLFWLVGLGMLIGAINMGKRRAVLAVVGDRLLVLQTGLFGSKRREWARGDIRDICAGPSGMAVNDVPVIELQIHPQEGWKVGLLAGRDNAELAWMAGTLRQALKSQSAAEPEVSK